MKCPACESTLTMTERQGVEIDYCPQCRGVWLDRGELDKIIERSAQYGSTPPAPSVPPRIERPSEASYQPYPATQNRDPYEQRERNSEDDRYERRRDDDYDEYGKGRKKKREGFLSELFDFD